MSPAALANQVARGYRLIAHFEIAGEPFIACESDMVIYLSFRDALTSCRHLPIEHHFTNTCQDLALLAPIKAACRALMIAGKKL